MAGDHFIVDPRIEQNEEPDSKGSRGAAVPVRRGFRNGAHADVSDDCSQQHQSGERAEEPHNGSNRRRDQIGRGMRVGLSHPDRDPAVDRLVHERRNRSPIDRPSPVVTKRRNAFPGNEGRKDHRRRDRGKRFKREKLLYYARNRQHSTSTANVAQTAATYAVIANGPSKGCPTLAAISAAAAAKEAHATIVGAAIVPTRTSTATAIDATQAMNASISDAGLRSGRRHDRQEDRDADRVTKERRKSWRETRFRLGGDRRKEALYDETDAREDCGEIGRRREALGGLSGGRHRQDERDNAAAKRQLEGRRGAPTPGPRSTV